MTATAGSEPRTASAASSTSSPSWPAIAWAKTAAASSPAYPLRSAVWTAWGAPAATGSSARARQVDPQHGRVAVDDVRQHPHAFLEIDQPHDIREPLRQPGGGRDVDDAVEWTTPRPLAGRHDSPVAEHDGQA